jgi:glycosyltransferase involved in cell wall biosynthesis
LDKPKVSIIIPVYNVEKYIRRCLDSILRQGFPDFECIVVDDCSPDSSPSICDEYGERDNRFRVIHNEKKQGSSIARRTGLEVARGGYVLFVDSDDWIESDMLETLYSAVLPYSADIVWCDYDVERGDGLYYKREQLFDCFDRIGLIKKLLVMGVASVLFNKLVRRDIYIGCLFPPGSRSEDYVITVQAILSAQKIKYINRVLYHLCNNPLSLTRDISRRSVGDMEENENWRIILSLLKKNFDNNLAQFEPELSVRFNRMKILYILDKQSRKNVELFKLYPESSRYIFQKSLRESFEYKLLLFLYSKKTTIPFRPLITDMLLLERKIRVDYLKKDIRRKNDDG